MITPNAPQRIGQQLRGVSHTPPTGRTDLRLAPPAPDDPEAWKRLMNLLFVNEEDELFRWLRSVRAVVEEAKV